MENKVYPLKKSSSFRDVALNGKKLKLSAWLTVQFKPSLDRCNYYGITASGKVANAIVRNKLKRWVRNCVKIENWPRQYNEHTLVFVFKPQAECKFFSKLQYADFKTLFNNIDSSKKRT